MLSKEKRGELQFLHNHSLQETHNACVMLASRKKRYILTALIPGHGKNHYRG